MNRKNIPIVFEGFVFILPLLVLTVIFAAVGIKSLALIFLILTLFVTNFFRNPERVIPTDANVVVSPADGKVLKIEDVEENDLITGKCKKVSIFMNVFNVHVNRVPYTGTVKIIHYQEGKFFNASLDKASSLNEKNSVLIRTNDGREILTVQIAGLVARRIVCWVKEGMNIERGERFGLIRFGSRLEVFMPVDAEILVRVGEKVRAGETIIGRLQ